MKNKEKNYGKFLFIVTTLILLILVIFGINIYLKQNKSNKIIVFENVCKNLSERENLYIEPYEIEFLPFKESEIQNISIEPYSFNRQSYLRNYCIK